MDDKEYYTLMNRTSSAVILPELKKIQKDKKSNINPDKNNTEKIQNEPSFTSLELRQGKADAEMLYEKNDKSGV